MQVTCVYDSPRTEALSSGMLRLLNSTDPAQMSPLCAQHKRFSVLRAPFGNLWFYITKPETVKPDTMLCCPRDFAVSICSFSWVSVRACRSSRRWSPWLKSEAREVFGEARGGIKIKNIVWEKLLGNTKFPHELLSYMAEWMLQHLRRNISGGEQCFLRKASEQSDF